MRAVATLAFLATTLSLAALAPAIGSVSQPRLVQTNPVNFTPNVDNGRVQAIAKVGNTIVLGGTFTSVTKGTTTFARDGLVAFEAKTGVVSTTFAPTLDGEVETVIPAGDGTSVYVGGAFTTVNGASHRKLVQLSVADGSVVAGFTPPVLDGKVNDLVLDDNALFAAGAFTTVGSVNRPALASFNATTGALTTRLNLAVSGVNNGGITAVSKIALTPDGDRLVAIGNFAEVAGQPRGQIALIDTSTTQATVAPWATDRFPNVCAAGFNTYLRDLDVSPDGDYFIVSTTGAYRGTSTLCDSISRWETSGATGDEQPTWVDYTGGDTTYAVTATGVAVYAGGHFRWLNNPYAANEAGDGAVPQAGIAALDPKTGLPFTWDAYRARGVGVFDMLATGGGLWIGSDTAMFSGERRGRIAYLSLTRGQELTSPTTPTLSGTVVQLGRPQGTTAPVDRAAFTPLSSGFASGKTTRVADAEKFRHARGAFVIDTTLYTPWADGRLRRRTLSDRDLGKPHNVDLRGGRFGRDAKTITGIFYEPATSRVYYTMSGRSQLYWRWFTPQSRTMGAVRFVADRGSLPAARVRGMFVSGDYLYFAQSRTGHLMRVGFDPGVTGAPGAGIIGTPTTVNSSRNWTAPGMTLAP
ncbi:MAG: hypothetical protein KDB63_09800 [Nocardioidaceae bacterium]|nr:hypothetical protein [Nocardioidaceae bacterium]